MSLMNLASIFPFLDKCFPLMVINNVSKKSFHEIVSCRSSLGKLRRFDQLNGSAAKIAAVYHRILYRLDMDCHHRNLTVLEQQWQLNQKSSCYGKTCSKPVALTPEIPKLLWKISVIFVKSCNLVGHVIHCGSLRHVTSWRSSWSCIVLPIVWPTFTTTPPMWFSEMLHNLVNKITIIIVMLPRNVIICSVQFKAPNSATSITRHKT